MFNPNDIVICLNDKAAPGEKKAPVGIKEGTHYTISVVGICCLTRVAIKEYPPSKESKWEVKCDKCGAPGVFGYYGWRFTKLTGDDIIVDDALPTTEQIELEEFIQREAEKLV